MLLLLLLLLLQHVVRDWLSVHVLEECWRLDLVPRKVGGVSESLASQGHAAEKASSKNGWQERSSEHICCLWPVSTIVSASSLP